MRVSKTSSLNNNEVFERRNLIIEEFKKIYADSKLSRVKRDKELGKRDFLILPYSKLDELIKSKIIAIESEAKQLSFHVLHETDEDDAYINKISEKNDVI